MDITITDIEKYLEEVKAAINAGCYRIEMNDNRKGQSGFVFRLSLIN